MSATTHVVDKPRDSLLVPASEILSPSLPSLPADLLRLIFELLSQKNICLLRLANKHLRQVITETRKLYLIRKYHLDPTLALDFNKAYADSITLPKRIATAGKISLENYEQTLANTYNSLAIKFFPNNDTPISNLLSDMAERYPLVRKLSLKAKEDMDHGWLTDDELIAFVSLHPQLTSLKLQRCVSLTEAAFFEVARTCSRLRHLSLETSPLTFEVVSAIVKNGKHLQSLHLSSEVDERNRLYIISTITDYRENLKQLKKISVKLRPHPNAPKPPISVICALDLFTSFKDLQEITLEGCDVLYDNIFTDIADNHASSLLKLSLDGCSEISEYGLAKLAKACRNLRELTLTQTQEPQVLNQKVSELKGQGLFKALRTCTIR